MASDKAKVVKNDWVGPGCYSAEAVATGKGGYEHHVEAKGKTPDDAETAAIQKLESQLKSQ